jgi:hypothetical protein
MKAPAPRHVGAVDAVRARSDSPRMSRRFNTAGPNNPEDHYTLPVLARLPDVRRLIDDKLYFVLHAPRQAGKTTALLALAGELTREGRYEAVLVSMESGVPFRDDIGMAEDAILDAWRSTAERRLPPELQPAPFPPVPSRPGPRRRPDRSSSSSTRSTPWRTRPSSRCSASSARATRIDRATSPGP